MNRLHKWLNVSVVVVLMVALMPISARMRATPAQEYLPLFDDWLAETQAGSERLSSEPPTPLPEDCDDVIAPGGLPPACCVHGYVYYGGVPVTGASVTVESASGSVTVATEVGDGSNHPYYGVNLSDSPLNAAVGDTITVTATYSEPPVTTTLTALADDASGSVVYQVVDGGQQVDVVMANRGSGVFTDSGQELGNSNSDTVVLGDLDGDGDLDAFVSNGVYSDEGNKVWLNDGAGNFTDSGQSLGNSNSNRVALGDVDGDDDLDAFVANSNGQASKIWLNDGTGNFTDSGQILNSATNNGIALGDLDGDGDLDAFVGSNEANKVWLNDGTGRFTDSGQSLGSSNSMGVTLGDIDDDGDLDAFITNYGQANRVWLNDGTAHFSDSGQSLGNSGSETAILGDMDSDGDLDVFVTNYGQANKVWLNNGTGTFSDSNQRLGSSDSLYVALGDVDGDGDLDAFVGNGNSQANKVWLNDGTGTFSDSGQSLGSSGSKGVALGDVDGDDDFDAFVANANQPNKVWLNTVTVADSDIAIRVASNYQSKPDAACSSDNAECLVVWSDYANDPLGSIYMQRGSSEGLLVGDIITIARLSVRQESPVVTYNHTDHEYFVVWHDGSYTAGFDVYGQRVDTDGTLIGSLIDMGYSSRHVMSHLDVVHNPVTNEYLAVWVDQRDDSSDIYGQYVRGDGTLRSDNFAVSADTGGHDLPEVACNTSNGEYLVIWDDERDGGNADRIYAQRLSSSGARLGSSFRVAPTNSTQIHPALAYNPTVDEYLVIWHDDRNGSSVYMRRMSSAGTLLGNEDAIVVGTAATNRAGQIAYSTSAHQYFATWCDSRNGSNTDADIYGQVIADDGTLIAANFSITLASKHQTWPSVDYNPVSHKFLAVWEDYRNDPPNSRDIYGQVYPLSAPPIATLHSITPNPATQGQDTITIRGSGQDQDEDGASIVGYEWRSDLDGALSTQAEFTKPASELAVGAHIIYFKVRDNEGEWSPEVTRTLTINSGGVFPPVASINYIWPNPATQGQDTIIFGGNSYDTDEGGAYIVAYEWNSSLDGLLSTQEDFTVQAAELSAGTHTITFKCQDDEGEWSPEASTTLTVSPPDADVRTLILVNRQKLAALYSDAEASQIMTELNALAAHASVEGLVVQVENDAAVASAYAAWDSAPTSTTRANAVTAAIKDVVDAQWAAHPNLEYLVIAGDDRAIPFRRVLDQTRYPESNYSSVACSSITGAALCDDMTLTDDYYADAIPTVPGGSGWDGHHLYIPDLGLGRLIESPSEIVAQIDAFLAADEIVANNAIVTGYDFVKDGAWAMCNVLAGDNMSTDCSLISESWNRANFIAKVLNVLHTIVSINGHANHYIIGTPSGHVSSSDIAGAGAEHTRAIFYTVGCHSGLNVPPSNPSQPLDLAQALVARRANYIANTGYGWGFRTSIGLSEQLMLDFTERLVYGQSATVGQALAAAKQEYYLNEGGFDYYDEKILIESTLYGLPMYRYTTPAALTKLQSQAATVVKTERLTVLADGLTRNRHDYQFPALLAESTDDGTLYHLGGTVHAGDGKPIQPKYTADLSFPQTEAHDVVFRGGSYVDMLAFNPVVDRAITETVTLAEPTFTAPHWYPAQFFHANHLERGDKLVTVLGQYNSQSQTERLYDELSFDIYYHSNSSDWTAPRISAVSNQFSDATLTVSVQTTDASGIEAVVVAYTNGTGKWESADLTLQGAAWTGNWTASASAEFFVQVVDQAGNVTVDHNQGRYFTPGVGDDFAIYLPLVLRSH